MRETIELRIDEATACRFFEPGEGRLLGDDLRVVKLAGDDPRLAEIARRQQQSGERFFGYWNITRRYTRAEIATADAFLLRIKGAFEPAAEEFDSEIYDDRDACPLCGTPRVQARNLTLDLRRVPKRGGLARTIAHERIVDQQVADLIVEHDVTGVSLRPVHHRAATWEGSVDPKRFPAGRELLAQGEAAGFRPGSWAYFVWLNRPEQRELSDAMYAQAAEERGRRAARRPPPPPWYQLVPEGDRVKIAPTTLVGSSLFSPDAAHERSRCPQGHVAGLSLISELHLDAATYPALDLVATEQLVGTRRGLLQPVPLLVISPRLRDLLVGHRINGWETEVACLD